MKKRKLNAHNAERNLSQLKTNLKLDWCSYEAAKYATEHWHYSHTMPKAKSCYLGVWENNIFIGSIIFGLGGGAATDGRKYGLRKSFDVAELERIALTKHISSVSRIASIAIKILKKQSPGIRLLVSYADPFQGHHGGIYQAMNWIYVGRTENDWALIDKHGRQWHSRVASKSGRKMQFGRLTVAPDLNSGTKIILPGKHKYLLPLDDDMRNEVLLLQKPYPKRATSETVDTSDVQSEERGSIPTVALQERK